MPGRLTNLKSMKDELRVTMIQADIIWEKTDDNLAMYSGLLQPLGGTTDLIILPEMFTTGFSMNAAGMAEAPGGKTMQWMARLAGELQCVITGSIIFSGEGAYFNRLIWMRPDGSYLWYDKRHIFRMGMEHLSYKAGNNRLITELNGWKICPLICYDLRFPVWCRNRYMETPGTWDYDVLVFVANWPASRKNIWSVLLTARAIENQSYAVGVNRVGEGNGIEYSGNSMAAGLTGEIISLCTEGEVMAKTVTLSYGDLMEERNKLQAGKDWDQFEII
jgi:omega-amidase